MISRWLLSRSARYSPVIDEYDLEKDPETRPSRYRWQCICRILVLVSLSGLSGFMLAGHYQLRQTEGLLVPAGDIWEHFTYNRTFSTAPTVASTQAWNDLFPVNGGFIHHPILAPNFSGVAVFHQLHCLHTLYNLYYSVSESSQHSSKRSPHHLSPDVHARHCFDYLRQSLMCHADTNLEQYNYELDGVTGWGTKQCRDYNSVVTFVDIWGGSKFESDHDEA